MNRQGLQGIDDIVSKLRRLGSSTGEKAGRAGVNAAITVMAKGIRNAINGSSASAAMKRAARTTIGKRVLKGKQQKRISGKVGAGVGKQTKAKKAKAIARSEKGKKGGGKSGVGISASNIHWPILGTGDRRHDSDGKHTGKMPPVLEGVVEKGITASESAALNAMKNKIADVIARDAARKG
jgi:hypothetical protein